jgi:hypothetical protein
MYTAAHLAGIVEAGTGRVLTDAFERSLRPGEQDEIAWAAEPGPVSARALLNGRAGAPVELVLGRREVSETELVALVLNAADLESRLAESGRTWGEFSRASVEIYANFERIAAFDYALRPACSGGARLCWWNRSGGIDHHTFEVCREQGVDVEKSSVRTGGRSRVLTSRLRKTAFAATAPATRARAERLAALAAAPQVWLAEGDRFVPVELSEKRVVTHDEQMTEIGFRFEHTEVEPYPAC